MARTRIDPELLRKAGEAEEAWRADTTNDALHQAYISTYNAAMNPDFYDRAGRARPTMRSIIARMVGR